ncbi:hypothetical protein GPROT1_01640 [Gammaproteobacteria bacterium]|nr:hypothetical protein GPROT1_01640 [Gammaproteobacteria bacterium]
MSASPRKLPRLLGVLLQRCPECRRGAVYHGLMSMHERCAVCGYRYGRETGYFTGAMYASYFIAVPVLIVIYAVMSVTFAVGQTPMATLAMSSAVFLLFVPFIFRYSRVIWMYIDRLFDPHGPERQS